MENKKYYLYVKTSPFGLKYLGKTTRDPFIYMGSGKIWKMHIINNNLSADDIKTEILFETDNVDDLIYKGRVYSREFNIVNSKDWANLREEAGDGGDTANFIDFSNPIFHDPKRSKHLNVFDSDEEKIRAILYRTYRINYKDPERARKIKENTDWESWRESIKNRKTDYSKFLYHVHEKNKKPILQLNLNGDVIDEFKSAIDASNKLNVKVGGIRQCLSGRNKTAFGYKWEYKIKI